MDLKGKRILVIGGAGLIGSHVVDQLLKEDVKEVIIYDNFTRGREDNLTAALKDPRCKIFEIGGDITQPDILNKAMEGIDGVFHLAALWLLHLGLHLPVAGALLLERAGVTVRSAGAGTVVVAGAVALPQGGHTPHPVIWRRLSLLTIAVGAVAALLPRVPWTLVGAEIEEHVRTYVRESARAPGFGSVRAVRGGN